MGDKYLTVKEWTKFAAECSFTESSQSKAFVKALGAAEKSANAPPAEQLQLLEALESSGRELFKLHKGDKKLESYLEDVYKPLKKYRKEAGKAEAQAAVADDEDGGPSWLEPKVLLKQLNLCRQDPERTINFAYVDGEDKAPGVLVMSPKVAAPALFKKLVAERGVKTGAFGSAWVDGTELMLQLDKPLPGLVKKMRAPIKASGFKASKIVLWSADGTVFESDAAVDEAPAAGPPEAVFAARLKALLPMIAAAGNTPEGQTARLLAHEAGTLARKADFTGANSKLDPLEKLLPKLGVSPSAGAPAASGAAPAAVSGSIDDALARWRQVRSGVVTTLKALAQEAAAEQDAESAQAVIEVQAVVKQLSADPRERQQVAELRRWLEQDDVVDDVCQIAADVRSPLLQALASIEAALPG